MDAFPSHGDLETPCNSRSVMVAGTCTRRHTIGLTSFSHTLNCRISDASPGPEELDAFFGFLVREVFLWVAFKAEKSRKFIHPTIARPSRKRHPPHKPHAFHRLQAS